MALPGKDIVEIYETRFGKRTVTAGLAVIGLAAVLVAGGVIWNAGKAAVSFLPTSFPVAVTWRDSISLGLVLGAFGLMYFVTYRRIRSLERDGVTLAKVDLQFVKFQNDVLGAVEGIQKNLQTTFDTFSKRLDEIDELTTFIPQPVKLDPGRAAILEKVKVLLQDAATQARQVGQMKQPTSLDGFNDDAVLHVQLINLIQNSFSYRVISDFEAWKHANELKDSLRNVKPDGKSHFVKLAGYLERLERRLTFNDLDLAVQLPASFAEYRKMYF